MHGIAGTIVETLFSSKAIRFALAATFALILGFPGVSALGADEAAGKRIVINIPSRTLWLYEGDKISRWFPVGVGRSTFQTPLGDYHVLRKVVNPVWEHPYKQAGAVRIGAGPNNPLGTRWIGFKEYKGGEYGIHGTDNPSSVGKYSSHGCVRMKTSDAEKLFELVNIGTPVNVIYETVLIRPEGDTMRVVVYPDAFGRGMPTVQEVREKILTQYPQVELDNEKITQALHHPTQQHVSVGRILHNDTSVAQKAAPAASENSKDTPTKALAAPAPKAEAVKADVPKPVLKVAPDLIGPAKPSAKPDSTSQAPVKLNTDFAREYEAYQPAANGRTAPSNPRVMSASSQVRLAPSVEIDAPIVPPSPMGQLHDALRRDFPAIAR